MKYKLHTSSLGNSLVATDQIIKGEIVLVFTGQIKSTPNWQSVQLDTDKHIWPNDGDIWPALNHSCNPNAFIKSDSRELIALRDIQIGEEIAFDYNTTEYEMATPFECHCGSENCIGIIRGAKFIER